MIDTGALVQMRVKRAGTALEAELRSINPGPSGATGRPLQFSGDADDEIGVILIDEFTAGILEYKPRLAREINADMAEWFTSEADRLYNFLDKYIDDIPLSNVRNSQLFGAILERYNQSISGILAELELGNAFLQAAQTGDHREVRALLDRGADVNFRHPRTRATALHLSAACGARAVIDELGKEKNIEYLVVDGKGRLPSSRAFEIAGNALLGEFLMKQEIATATENELDFRAILTGEVPPPGQA